MGVFLFLLLAPVLLLLVSGGYVFAVACLRRKDLPWLVEEEIKHTPYGKYYRYMADTDLWLKAHEAQNVYIQSHDGLKLHGLWLPAENPRGTVLMAHGYRSTMLCDFGLSFVYYRTLGFNILVPEQRSHGQSQGRYITFGVRESRDMEQWIAFHNETYGTQPLVLCGISMGASTVLYLADKSLPSNVKGIIADCGFTSPAEIIGTVFRRVIHLPPTLALWTADLFSRLLAHFSLYEMDTRKSLARSRLPVLLIHGTGDDFVPCEMSKAAYAACGSKKALLLVQEAGHGLSFAKDQPAYSQAVLTFLEENLEEFQ